MSNNPKAPYGTPKEWPEWTDQRGNTYRPGDTVAVAAVRHKAATLHIGTVIKINRINSKGEEIGYWSYDPQTQQKTLIPSCTVTVLRPQPYHQGQDTQYTYQDPSNIIKLD